VAIDPRVERPEWGGITRFTWNRGHWSLQNGAIHAHTAEDADAWTGHAYLRDVTVTADLTPLAGRSHLVAARVQGTSRFYAAGIENGEAVIVKQDHGTTVLARAPYDAAAGQPLVVSLTARGEELSLAIDGQQLLTATDGAFRYGQAGLRMASAGRMTVQRLEVVEL
jgi:hypothetical protein